MFLTDSLTRRMGVEAISPVKVSVIIDTMLNFDSNFYGHDNGNITRKQTFTHLYYRIKMAGGLDNSYRTHYDIYIFVQFKVLLLCELGSTSILPLTFERICNIHVHRSGFWLWSQFRLQSESDSMQCGKFYIVQCSHLVCSPNRNRNQNLAM